MEYENKVVSGQPGHKVQKINTVKQVVGQGFGLALVVFQKF